MFPDLAVIQGNYVRDILSQPQALEDTLRGLEGLDQLRDLTRKVNKGKFERILLTGMGSSFHALHPVNLELIGHGLTALMVETSELVHYQSRLFDPKTLIIAVSQSGRSAEVIRLLKTNRKRSALLAVTNTPDSPLARQADAAALTCAGHEFSVSCKTYVTTLMALKWIGDILCEKDLRRTHRELKQAASAVSEYLLGWEGHVQSLLSELKGIGQLFFVGRGASLAAVGTGGLIVKESDHFDAEGMSSAAFRHGPFEMLSDQTFVLVFSGNARTRNLNRKLLGDIREHRGRAEWLGEDGSLAAFRVPATVSSIHPILEILPVQMVTLALAAQLGREPGRFELTSKVTTTE